MDEKGVLLVNLGSPAAPTTAAVRRYLAEFLGDPMVVDANPVVWWLVRNLIVLPFRSPKSAELYRSVWTEEGSPLVAISRRQRDGLARELGPTYRVELAMRYGQPSIAGALARLGDAGCEEVLLVPMFPQASRTTTGTVERAVERAREHAPASLRLTTVAPYYAHEAYVAALAARVRETLTEGEVDHVVLSFHGLPTRLVEREGDPYRDHCEATAAALARALDLAPGSWTLAYQSRFGREPWLEPDVVDVVRGLAGSGARVLVACPGFTADCLETLEEISLRLVESFREHGGRDLRVVPCLNDHPVWTAGLAAIVRETCEGAGARRDRPAGREPAR
jgi:ferrochelatase